MFGFFLIWLLLSLGVAALAASRGRSGVGFFLLSFFFSPLLGFIIVLVTRNLAKEAEQEAVRKERERQRDLDRQREHEKHLESLRVIATSGAERSPATKTESARPASLADELTKLAELRDKGVLSSVEFEREKAKLLSSQ